uniref:uncharacterized protein LOC131101700 isoform X2 n=1 Tax=Doryrhamphus excisus TaxID=161450 RepID=UPI0025ADC896|nr:uncharacterized protein LOC131101700 isoform X2 [Doryrhamphus excisus]
MDSLETPYEDDSATDFIECTVCDKSARGLSLYKIHLTTQGHLKKEEAVVAAGGGVRERSVPMFKDILHYLDYLKLDEPIIGLNYVEEVYRHTPNSDLGPKYTCILCNTTAHLPEIVSHIIGRKHRQKYMESKRPDLVTWDKDSLMAQGGKMIRTRAEIIERQDGRGHPVLLKKWDNVGQEMSAPPRPRQNGNPQNPQALFQLDLPQGPPKRQDFPESQHGMLPPDHSHRTSFPPAEARGPDAERRMYQEDDWQRDLSRRRDLDYRQQESQTRGVDPREQVPYGGWSQRYPDEAPPYRRTPLETNTKEDVKHMSSSDYQHPSYQEDEHRWSHDPSVNTIGDRLRLGSSIPEPPAGNLPSLPHMETPRRQVRDYKHGEVRQGELLSNSAPSGWSGPAQTPREDSRSISDIPEPFRRFMKWPGDNDDGGGGEACGKRKRKSRFTDATAEEVEVAHKILNTGYGPPDPQLRAHSRPGGRAFEAETRGPMRRPDRFLESQDSGHSDSLQNDGAEKETVFDMLNDIEIENVEEATFLKNKLTSLLKEFKALKSKKNEQKSPTPQMSTQLQHRRTPWGDSDFRRTEEDNRERGWRTHETNVHDGQQDYQHRMRGEPTASGRSRYDDVSVSREMYPTRHPDELAQHPQRFQENTAAHHDRRPVSQGYFDQRPPLPHDMERGVLMNRGPQYSKSLEKLTSTLLELVSRKQQEK